MYYKKIIDIIYVLVFTTEHYVQVTPFVRQFFSPLLLNPVINRKSCTILAEQNPDGTAIAYLTALFETENRIKFLTDIGDD